MNLLYLTLSSTAENLAADEALLNHCDALGTPVQVLRLWENPQLAVVAGRSSKIGEEVNLQYCQANSIQVFRRSSGGASVVIGPGCLMYSIVLDYRLHPPPFRLLDQTHEFVMERVLRAVSLTKPSAKFQGTCDLTINNKKFSGNSLRCKRNSLLYHGTLLYDFPLDVIQDCLLNPPRQPDYRQSRSHHEFVANLDIAKETLQDNLIDAWNAKPQPIDLGLEEIASLAASKYENHDWTFAR